MNPNDTESRFDAIVREARSSYSIRYVGDRWRVYRGTVAILSYIDGAEALATLRELLGDIEMVKR